MSRFFQWLLLLLIAGCGAVTAQSVGNGSNGHGAIGNGGPVAIASSSPTASPTPGPILCAPNSVTFSSPTAPPTTVACSETYYTGSFTASPTPAGIVSASISGSTITLTPETVGAASVKVANTVTQTASIPVSVASPGATSVPTAAYSNPTPGTSYPYTVTLPIAAHSTIVAEVECPANTNGNALIGGAATFGFEAGQCNASTNTGASTEVHFYDYIGAVQAQPPNDLTASATYMLFGSTDGTNVNYIQCAIPYTANDCIQYTTADTASWTPGNITAYIGAGADGTSRVMSSGGHIWNVLVYSTSLSLAQANVLAATGISDPYTPAPSTPTPYPAAGWMPFTAGPLTHTVAQDYGSNPLGSTCNVSYTPPSGYPGPMSGVPCLYSNSAAIATQLWGNNPTTFGGFSQDVGTQSQLLSFFESPRYSAQGAFFVSKASDPVYTVTGATCAFASAGQSTCRTGTVHIPVGAIPEIGSDHHLYIRDTSSGSNVDWAFWSGLNCTGYNSSCQAPNGTGGNISALTSDNSTYSDVFTATQKATEGLGITGTAGHVSMLYSIRAPDVQAGRIPHAVLFYGRCNVRYNTSSNTTSIVYPDPAGAGDDNYFCDNSSAAWNYGVSGYTPTNNNNIVYGGHLWLDVPYTLLSASTASGCDPVSWAILRALNEFGGYMNDTQAAGGPNAPLVFMTAASINDVYAGGTTDWTSIMSTYFGLSSPGAGYWTLNACGITNFATHFHVLVPPPQS